MSAPERWRVELTRPAERDVRRLDRPVRERIFAGAPALEVMLDAGSRAVASLPVMSPSGRLIAMISTHHHRRPAWTYERKLRLEQMAGATGRLLDDLTPMHSG